MFTSYTQSQIQNSVNHIKHQHHLIAQNGLDPVYRDFQEYLFDFYPDLPWSTIDQHKAINMLLSDSEWLLTANQIKQKYNFDFVQELTNALTAED